MPIDPQLLLFAGSKQGVYLIGDIFDPDIHDEITGVGKTVPAVGSTVYDNVSSVGQFIELVVSEVNGTTLKSTLISPQHIPSTTLIPDRLVSYGNDTMVLYYDDRGTPTSLVIDTKFVLIGANSAEYLLKQVINGDETIISQQIDNNGAFVSERIPIIDGVEPGTKVFTNATTTFPLVDGDFVNLEIYDSTGALTTIVRMITKRSSILNDFLAATNPIVGFTATANQTNGADWVIFRDQNPLDLNIYPQLTFSNGESELLTIDGINTFIYGIEEINTAVTGVQYNVIIKHFLADDVPSTIAQGNGTRFVLFEQVIKIVERSLFSYSKISVVPKWNVTGSIWELVYFGYNEDRSSVVIIPGPDIQYVGDTFDGLNETSIQNLTIHTNTVDPNGGIGTYEQLFSIRLNAFNSITPYTIAENESTTFIYGENSSLHNRPVINFDVGNGTYFVPTSEFLDLTAFLDDFYDRAAPPFLAITETQAPTPTHFTLRDCTNARNLVALPIDVNTYNQEFVIITISGNPDEYNNSTVIVEFLADDGNGGFNILYGVPVEVVSGTYVP